MPINIRTTKENDEGVIPKAEFQKNINRIRNAKEEFNSANNSLQQ